MWVSAREGGYASLLCDNATNAPVRSIVEKRRGLGTPTGQGQVESSQSASCIEQVTINTCTYVFAMYLYAQKLQSSFKAGLGLGNN